MPIPHAAAILTQNQQTYRQRDRGFRYTGFFSIDGGVASPGNQSYFLSLFLPSAISVDWIAYQIGTGSCTLAVQAGPNIAGLANITTLTALSCTGTLAITDCTATDSTSDVPIGSVLALVVSAGAGGPANLAFSLGYHRR